VTHDADVAAFASRTLRFRDGRMIEDSRYQPVDAEAMLRQKFQ
jgi:putative ABC transport system ATP-binding protein